MRNKLKNYKNSTKTKFWVPSLLISLCYNESIKVKRNEANRNRKKEDFFMKILENNNKSNSLEENLILVETIPIKEYTYNRLVVSFRGKLWII